MEETAEGQRKFQNEELHNLYSSSVIMEIKSTMRWQRQKAQGCTNSMHQVTVVIKFCVVLHIFVDPRMARPSCHHSGMQNFEVAPRFLENLCTPNTQNA